ncbi:hypothetical protein NLJ89_g9301 [Agrocybe chaxingu]|uniref:Uncharacterized protein n=1 Tax=Agrocybe chaxingu TaxID=84603 RepID=A0A9W8JTB8_9AGAR|nr:hypothetical protein NLJ89_g9301 [Agrocybe chaxingu]
MAQTRPQQQQPAAAATASLPNFDASTIDPSFGNPDDSSNRRRWHLYPALWIAVSPGEVNWAGMMAIHDNLVQPQSEKDTLHVIIAASVKGALSAAALSGNLTDIFHQDAIHAIDNIAAKIAASLHEHFQRMIASMVDAAVKVHLLKDSTSVESPSPPPIVNAAAPDDCLNNPCYNAWADRDEIKPKRDAYFLEQCYRTTMAPNLLESCAVKDENSESEEKSYTSTSHEDLPSLDSTPNSSAQTRTIRNPTTLLPRPSILFVMWTMFVLTIVLLLAVAARSAYGSDPSSLLGSDVQEPHRLWVKYMEEARAQQFFLFKFLQRAPSLLLGALE